MKRLFWLLILINLGLFAYFNMDYMLPSKPPVKSPEIEADKIQILTPQQIAALPRKKPDAGLAPIVTVPPATNTACYEWGIFSDSDLASAQAATTKLALHHAIKEQTSQQAKRFWVYIPPLKSTADAQRKAGELKASGIEDLFVVQEAKWKNAISFGIFADEQLAIKLLNELKAKGVKEATKTLRTQGKIHSSLLLSNLTETDLVELKKLKPDFPGADLHEVSCN